MFFCISDRALRETPVEHLHLARRHFATGWSGKIVRGTYEGQRVVVKLAPVGSKRGEVRLFVNHFYSDEIHDYETCRCICSTYVNFVVCSGSLDRG